MVAYIDHLEHQLETERSARQRAELKLKAHRADAPRPAVRSAGKDERTQALEVLGLTGKPSEEEVRQAYRDRARDTHPDSATGDSEEFQRVKAAMEALLK